ELAPIINFRDFHSVNKQEIIQLKQNVNGNKVKIIVDEKSSYPIYMNLSEGKYNEQENNIFKNMFYIEEEKRGFDAEENHVIPGIYEIEIKPNVEKEISLIISLEENIEELNVKNIIDNEIIRLNTIFNNSLLIDNRKIKKDKKELEKDEEIKNYLIATDNFIVYRPTFGYHTIIAGYPWFLDWGRDSLISFEGLLLIPKRFQEAKEVLLTLVRDIKKGLVPNGYSGFDNRPLYNSVDASLLLFEQIQKYIQYTGDYEFVKENLYEKMKNIIKSYIEGIDVDNNNIYLDKDNLIVSGRSDTQNTWMDVKIGNIAVTPRNGKTVEINALWYNALMIMSELLNKYKDKKNAKVCKQLAENCKQEFNQKFYNKKRKSLYDVLDDEKIRPNQLFSMSLTYQIIDTRSEIAKNIIKTVETQLLNEYGLQTLSAKDEGFIAVYEGGEKQRDSSYHQGITWPWLLGLYYNALKNIKKETKIKNEEKKIEEKILAFIERTEKTFKKELYENGCIGNIAEIYDSKKPQLPKGTIAQAWSISEIFRIILGK
ncbi:MAG: amylo-alpha-1,6-glucosidase, partial [Clostridia bacterium]